MTENTLHEFRCARCSYIWSSDRHRQNCPECVRTMRQNQPGTPLQPVQFAWDALKAKREVAQGLSQDWNAPDMAADSISKMFKADIINATTNVMMEAQIQQERLRAAKFRQPQDNRVEAITYGLEAHMARMRDEAARHIAIPNRSGTNVASSYEMMERMKDMQRLIDHQGQSIAALTKDNRNLRAENTMLRLAPPKTTGGALGNAVFQWDADLGMWIDVTPAKPTVAPTVAPADHPPIFRAIAVRDRQHIGMVEP